MSEYDHDLEYTLREWAHRYARKFGRKPELWIVTREEFHAWDMSLYNQFGPALGGRVLLAGLPFFHVMEDGPGARQAMIDEHGPAGDARAIHNWFMAKPHRAAMLLGRHAVQFMPRIGSAERRDLYSLYQASVREIALREITLPPRRSGGSSAIRPEMPAVSARNGDGSETHVPVVSYREARRPWGVPADIIELPSEPLSNVTMDVVRRFTDLIQRQIGICDLPPPSASRREPSGHVGARPVRPCHVCKDSGYQDQGKVSGLVYQVACDCKLGRQNSTLLAINNPRAKSAVQRATHARRGNVGGADRNPRRAVMTQAEVLASLEC